MAKITPYEYDAVRMTDVLADDGPHALTEEELEEQRDREEEEELERDGPADIEEEVLSPGR